MALLRLSAGRKERTLLQACFTEFGSCSTQLKGV
jgi:hypothetical protein